MTITSLIQQLTGLVNVTIGIATMIALFFVFWGIFQAFGNAENVDKRADARKTLVWSLIALFVIVSLGGIIAVFTSSFPLL